MAVLLAFIVGALLGIAIARSWRGKPPAPIDVSKPVEALIAPPKAPAAELLEMTEELNKVGEASSHPRDVMESETFRKAVALMAAPSCPLGTVTDYAFGANWMLSAAAHAALLERTDRLDAKELVIARFKQLRPWPMLFALQYIERLQERPSLGGLLLNVPEWWAENTVVPGLLAEHFSRREAMGDAIEFAGALQSVSPTEVDKVVALLQRIEHPATKGMMREIDAWKRNRVDRSFLESFGRFVHDDPAEQLLIEHEAIADQLALAEACIARSPPRSMLVIGDARSGKSAFIRLLARRIAADGWLTFEAGTANLMAGQKYIGELEERVRRALDELSVEKRVLWYVPNFAQLATSGTHQGQSASLLDQIFPALASGRIVLIGETSVSLLTKLIQLRPAVRSAVEQIRLRPLSDAQIEKVSRDFVARLSDTLELTVESDVLDTATHMARHYLGSAQMPGAVLDLLKLAAQRVAAAGGSHMQREDLLGTLAQLTGMPRLVLDDREKVDLAQLRQFFGSKVIGQPEAVDAVIDRIAMLKAGLTDPNRPVGVFLFAGPTGTGKTELAKTLAEFLFGAAERLVRLDMSEFQSHDSARKIIGDPHDGDDGQALTHRVRKQPFCVVLLDEFEKAHSNVWDLFLQVFDDGRLSDAAGHAVDFRHAIIILTSNLGATAHQSAGMGFASSASSFSNEQVMRAVNQSFRPEFVNRIDRVLVFRPLTRDLMRGILAKELRGVLERRGLRHREWAVEWESSALDFLLDKGFSPAMGARPLKRAIDQYLLAPLAATLVEHRFPQGDQFLFVRSDGREIQVEFVNPDAPATASLAEVPMRADLSIPQLILHADGKKEEQRLLQAELERLARAIDGEVWHTLQSELAGEMNGRDFWDRDDRHAVLARYALLDRVKAAFETALNLEQRLTRTEHRAGRFSSELITRLAAQLYVLDHGIQDALSDAPVEVAIAVESALDHGPETAPQREWRDQLLSMYRAWSVKRRMQLTQIEGPPTSGPILLVAGFGAARILSGEAGLHVQERDAPEEGRVVARVLMGEPPGMLPPGKREQHAALRAELLKNAGTAIVRRYRLESAPLVRDASGGWRTGRAELVLQGDFDLLSRVLSDRPAVLNEDTRV